MIFFRFARFFFSWPIQNILGSLCGTWRPPRPFSCEHELFRGILIYYGLFIAKSSLQLFKIFLFVSSIYWRWALYPCVNNEEFSEKISHWKDCILPRNSSPPQLWRTILSVFLMKKTWYVQYNIDQSSVLSKAWPLAEFRYSSHKSIPIPSRTNAFLWFLVSRFEF